METVFSPGQVRLGKHTGPEGAYMFSVGWKPDLAIKERIRKNDHYAEPLLQPISEMTAEDIMKEAIRRGFKPTYGLLLHRWHSTDINRAYQFLESFELESEEV